MTISTMRKFTTELTRQTKRIYVTGGVFTLPKSNVVKYPVLFDTLLTRIENLQFRYNRHSDIMVFDLQEEKSKALLDLKNLGGVYILWSKSNGMFYVGSAIRYFTNKGRLTDYFMPSRVKTSLLGVSSKVSPDLAKAIHEYGIIDFILIVVETHYSQDLTKSSLLSFEQF